MNVRTLLAVAVGALMFGFGGTAVAHAQCQDQTCQAPSSSGNPSCYTCTGASNSYCTLSGSCPTSCTEGSCSTTDPCTIDPTAAGCENPCLLDPNAPEGCGTEIICDGTTITSCDGTGGTGGGGGGGGCDPTQIICFARHLDRSVLKEVAALLPRKASGSCQTAVLPNKLLFSL